MIKNILVVDDDRILRHLIKKKFQKYENIFSVLTAEDGVAAVEQLKINSVSLVVTDLHMPNMDGFALLAYLSEHYPDIPVIIFSAFGTPASKKDVIEKGALSFVEKPFVVEDLVGKIKAALDKEEEGGKLQTIPLEIFTQLIEMEQKTCTIRLHNKSSGEKGVLFFRQGELMDARIRDLKNKPAAYEIFSWSKVTLFIEDNCPITNKRIDGDLQAILFEALRRKDEAEYDEEPVSESLSTESIHVKINEADAYRTHGLYKEALGIYNEILKVIHDLDPEIQKTIKEKIRLFRAEIKKKK